MKSTTTIIYFKKKFSIKISPVQNIFKKMFIYFDRIDAFEGIDINEISASKVFDTCHYWYFLNYSFKFQPNVLNRCHNLSIL